MRGEHPAVDPYVGKGAGSSPHARGALPLAIGAPDRAGIIPACAGSTAPLRPCRPPPWDHPRMRGEHCVSGVVESVRVGSSPHARGARNRRHLPSAHKGIIPACAGSTIGLIVRRSCARDHPRMRGEHHGLSA